ncbi:CheR family methyltransferase [Entomohabitans teleogrylli]|uniref:CheR family methyltransferase n=1 Tax=Entomohabitans teleogrylli TaxID=1384589 RepID=UPI00073D9769|nr:CheR family methyltransferase [Entomohabitans teleogrylli]
MNNICRAAQTTPRALSIEESISSAEIARIGALIYQRAGIVLTHQKRDMVYNRLSRRLRELNMTHFSDYLRYLEDNPHCAEWQAFINALTTNLTSFFRESYHFPILAGHAQARRGAYSVWCTAASTGEEACSVAITLDETLGRCAAGPRVWATDIDTDVLSTARAGIYRLNDLSSLTAEQKKHYFLRGVGAQQNRVKVRKTLLETIHYQHLNLLDQTWDVPAPFDAIFCRNVMIYFDQKTQTLLLKRFAGLLKPGGLLFVGHSEHFGNINGSFRLRGQSVYELSGERG